jgi:hypothetical protein
MTAADWVRMDTDSKDYDKVLMARGILVAAEALHGREAARTVRVRNGDALVTDGPFMESKEAIGGFILIEVTDADMAMEVAKGIPMARLGAVEVRPVMAFR